MTYAPGTTIDQAETAADKAVTAPQLAEELNKKFENFEGANVKAQLLGVGPP